MPFFSGFRNTTVRLPTTSTFTMRMNHTVTSTFSFLNSKFCNDCYTFSRIHHSKLTRSRRFLPKRKERRALVTLGFLGEIS